MALPTGIHLAEARAVRRRIFRETILGLGREEEYVIVGRTIAARQGLHGHTAATVRELLEGLAWHELPPTPLARELVKGVMLRVNAYITGHADVR
jgi:hypothetical protein